MVMCLEWETKGCQDRRCPGNLKAAAWRRTIQRLMRTKELEAEDVECMAQQREGW